MKLSELRPCGVCGGPIGMLFYRVTVEQTLIDAMAANQVLGLNAMFGGRALRLAEVFSPVEDVTIQLQQNIAIVCEKCAYSVPLASVLFSSDREGPEGGEGD